MFDATRLCLLAQTACHVRYPWNNYSPLLCSQDIALSILGADILYPSATRHALVVPYQAPREASEDGWGDKAKSIDPGRRRSDCGEGDVCGQASGIGHQTSDSRTKGDPQRLDSWDGRRSQDTFARAGCHDAPATNVREA